MKKTLFIGFTFLGFLVSCSHSDDSDPVAEGIYQPLELGNYWTYDTTGESFSGRDSLYIQKDTLIQGDTYKKFKTKEIPYGFFSNSLNNNGLRKDGYKLLFTGTAGLNFAETLPVDINLKDFVIFKQNASANQVLDSEEGIIEQDFSGYPLKIEYTLKTTAMETLSSFTSPDGSVYSDVKSVRTTLQLKITTVLTLVPGFPTTVLILDEQNVVSSLQYYAKNIGVVYINTNISYQLENLPIDIGIPTSHNDTREEFLDTYQIN